MNIQLNIDSDDSIDKTEVGRTINILIVGNFGGPKGNIDSAAEAVPIRNMLSIDALNIDAAMRKLMPSVSLGDPANPLTANFSSLDDFHPDNLFATQPAFAVITELKQSLKVPSKAAAAALICQQFLGKESEPKADKEHPTPAVAETSADDNSDDMFGRLLGASASRSEKGNKRAQDVVQQILGQAVDAEFVPSQEPELASLQDDLDSWCANSMRELLRSEEFRQIEMAWRSLQWLGEQVEFDDGKSLWILDVSDDSVDSWAPKLPGQVLQSAAGSIDLLVSLYEFNDSPESLNQLKSLAELAAALGVPALAAAGSTLAGTSAKQGLIEALDGSDVADSQSELWESIRTHPAAKSIALGFPRILLRQPYGRRSDAIESFKFEELESAPNHESFAWGNPAIVLAAMELNDRLQIEDLPMVTFDDGTGQAIKPPAEVYLTDSANQKLVRKGLTPLLSQRGHTDVRTTRLQSIADPPTTI